MKYFSLLLFAALCASLLSLASCCEPSSRNSQPFVVDSLFSDTSGYSLDLYRTGNGTRPDSGYFPIYTFAVQNIGTDDDDFTMSVRIGPGYGFDMRKHVRAGELTYFRTPTSTPDSLTRTIDYTYYRAGLISHDSLPLMADVYYGFFRDTPDSVRIFNLRPSVTITHGSIDNGPEGCNAPAETESVDITRLRR